VQLISFLQISSEAPSLFAEGRKLEAEACCPGKRTARRSPALLMRLWLTINAAFQLFVLFIYSQNTPSAGSLGFSATHFGFGEG